MLFADLAKVDFKSAWNGKFVLFCFTATLLSIILVALFSLLWKDKTIQGEFIQASYRSSAAILGIAFIQNIYGNTGMAPLMIIGSVPLYNIMAGPVIFPAGTKRSGLEGFEKDADRDSHKSDYSWYCCRICVVCTKNTNASDFKQDRNQHRSHRNTAWVNGYGSHV